MGTETTGGFRNININNIVIKPSADQAEKFCGQWLGISAIALEIVDGGVMENINLSNFTVEGTLAPIFIRLANRARPHLAGIKKPGVGRINDVRISNVTVYNAGKIGSSITGIPGHCVENVKLSNITIHHKGGVTENMLTDNWKDERETKYPEGTSWGILPAKGFFVRHARNIEFENVVIKTEQPDVRPDYIEIDAIDITKK
jgi:polygalacturonase